MITNYRMGTDRLVCLCFIVVFLITSSVNLSVAQKPQEIREGVFRIKVSEGLFKQLEKTKITKRSPNEVHTGIETLDVANKHHKVNNMRRVFPDGGKFEAKHRKYGLHRWYELEIDKSVSVLQTLAGYRSLKDIEKVEPLYKKEIIGSGNENFGPVVLKKLTEETLPETSNDPLLSNQWHYNNTGQTGGTAGADISLLQAWGIETGNRSIIVSVHDGGIQINHVDLANNIWINPNEIQGNGIDDDNNGYIDDVNGYGFADNTGNIYPDNHGSHVGGTIAATNNNGTGVAGIAGGSGNGDGVRLMSCAVFGNFNVGGFAESYIYAADNGSVISQNSWGYTSPNVYEQSVLDAIDYFIAEAGRDELGNQTGPMNGGIVIFAAGNGNSSEAYYPGYYAPVFSVAATNHLDMKAWYSNYGTWVDIAAPGGETSVTQQGVLSTLIDNQYGYFQGTSMACPHVSGVAALLVSRYGGPGFTPASLRSRIMQTADNIDSAHPAFAGMLGSGRMNAFAALQQDDETPPETITDLSVAAIGITNVQLAWTAPADAGNGFATNYDLRYSTSPITEENFSDASAVNGLAPPASAGTPEFFRVMDLLPGTTYYFSIRSTDFFNNVSGISNVLEQATNFPPSIEINPHSITADLLTAGLISKSLTISNNGLGPLYFVFDSVNLISFFTVSIQQGTVSPNASADVEVIFDGNGLLTGTYEDSLVIWTNDPLNPQLVISVTVNVTNNGYPIATVSPQVLDFGDVFQGASKQIVLSIHNAGSENLVISNVESDNADFTFSFNEPIAIAPFADSSVAVTYIPSSLGLSQGTLNIYTNDPDRQTLSVRLSGSGTEAPAIQVSPEAVSATLFSNHTVTKQLTVQNHGGSDLEFSVKVSSSIPATTTSLKHIDVPRPASLFSSTGARMVPSSPANQSSGIEVQSVTDPTEISRVLILSPDYYVQDLAFILNSMGGVAVDVFPYEMLASVSVSDLIAYDVVLTTNNFQWIFRGANPAVVGDVLADYVDQGGNVIMNQFSFAEDFGWKIEGRLEAENYSPFVTGVVADYAFTSLGPVHQPDHPVIARLNFLNYTGFLVDVGLADGATAIASWDTGHLFVAAKNNVVAVNLLPSTGYGGSFPWQGDLPLVFHNAIKWLSGPSYVRVNPVVAVVSPGEQITLDVTFDARGLNAADYAASIDVVSNVPGNELVSVPATLTVTGPQFSMSASSVLAELMPGETSTQALTMQNNGNTDHIYEISIQYPGGSDVQDHSAFVSVSPSTGTIAAGEAIEFLVSFDATGLLLDERYISYINITADVDRITIPAVIHVPAPEFVVNPASIYREIEIGETVTETVTLQNTGRGEHPFEITVQNYGIFAAMAMVKKLGIVANPLDIVNPDTRPLTALMEKLSLNPREKFDPKVFNLPQNVKSPLYTVYATSFDEFIPGGINQNGWYGWGSWNVSTDNPYTGNQHIRLSGEGMDLHNSANSPWVGIGYQPFSSTTMKVMLQGSGTYRWIIPHSPTAQEVPTAILFFPDNTIGALIKDGAGNVYFENVPVQIPSGYFDVTIEVERSTSRFSLYFNEAKVFTGQGLSGNIEYVEVYSRNESSTDAIYDVDDFQLIDGKRIFRPFLTVAPSAGSLAPGESVDLAVTMNTEDLFFGLYPSDVIINVADVRNIYVPAHFLVVGDPAIEVSPALLETIVDYKSETYQNLVIKNTGGRPLYFNLDASDPQRLVPNDLARPVSKFAEQDLRVVHKLEEDRRLSKNQGQVTSGAGKFVMGQPLLIQYFDEGVFPPPLGWNIFNDGTEGLVWNSAWYYGEGNYCAWGDAATVSRDAFGVAEFDTEIQTPVINADGYENLVLQYYANYQNFGNRDILDLDILIEGSASWENILRWNEDHGSFRGYGEFVSLTLDAFLNGAQSFQLRWHYYDPNEGDEGWYAQIDNVVILGDPTEWLTLSPASGVVPAGGEYFISAYFQSHDLDAGMHSGAVQVNSNAVLNPIVNVPVSLTVLEPSRMVVTPTGLQQTVASGRKAVQSLIISNEGESMLYFSFKGLVAPYASAYHGDERREAVGKRGDALLPNNKTNDISAFIFNEPSATRNSALPVYATGFEEFVFGDVSGQHEWFGHFGNWTVESNNPFNGSRHLQGRSDGANQVSLSQTPVVASGTSDISSATMKLKLIPNGVTWQIIPQSLSAGTVNTRFEIGPYGELKALVMDGAGNPYYQNILAYLPNDYFELRFDFERATSMFRIFFNGKEVFQGQGVTGNIEQVVFWSLMEYPGPIMEVDDVAILDGTPLPPWLFVYPQTGTVPAGESFEATVLFDATALSEGTYDEELHIRSNDPERPEVSIPASIQVVRPPEIIVEPQTLKEILYAGTSSDQSLKIANLGEAGLNFSFLGYSGFSTNAAQIKNNTSRIYPVDYKVDKNFADSRKGHPVLTGQGGLDNFGHKWIDSNEPGGPVFDWTDITATGIPVFLTDDDMIRVNMPFEFQFYGNSYSEVTIGSNGYLTFGLVGWPYWNMEIPNAEEPNDILPVFWDDLYPPAGGSIHYYGDAEKFVVQYTNVPYYYANHLPNTFQVILYSNGTIVYQYLSMNDTQSATIGIENQDGSDGLQVAFNTGYTQNNLAILFTNAANIPWITPEPVSGTVDGGTNQLINLKFNAEDMVIGEYEGILTIYSDDPKIPFLTIPVALEVTDNFAPVIHPVTDMNLIETESVKVTFTATDRDDANLSIAVANAPGFFKMASSGNGTATYSVKPKIGDAGDYSITLVATDSRGKISTSIFDLSVIQYGVEGFSLVNSATGEVYNEFSEMIVINQQDANFPLYAIRANTNPEKVGSVLFSLNGKTKNRANNFPYLFAAGELQKLKIENYILKAQAFTEKAGKGKDGKAAEALIQIVNSSQAFASASEEQAINIYPMPVDDELNIQLTGTFKGRAEVLVLNTAGHPVFHALVDVELLKEYKLNAIDLGLGTGIYYLQILGENGVRVTRRFIKR
ncbi:MAG: S8 family serine peptidase [Cyclobacteriaceae bacterium]